MIDYEFAVYVDGIGTFGFMSEKIAFECFWRKDGLSKIIYKIEKNGTMTVLDQRTVDNG